MHWEARRVRELLKRLLRYLLLATFVLDYIMPVQEPLFFISRFSD